MNIYRRCIWGMLKHRGPWLGAYPVWFYMIRHALYKQGTSAQQGMMP